MNVLQAHSNPTSAPGWLHRGALACAVFWLATAGDLARASVPDAIGTFNNDLSQNVFTFPASASFACGAVSISGTPMPTVTATASNCVNPMQAILTYYFEIFGPANAALPFVISSSSTLFADGQAVAGVTLAIGGQAVAGANCYVALQTGCGTHSSATAISLVANQLYSVSMNVIAHNLFGAGSASALLDPTFAFDPSFANAGAYTMEFSRGIGNGVAVSPVPEPEILATLLVGLGALGARRRFARPPAGAPATPA